MHLLTFEFPGSRSINQHLFQFTFLFFSTTKSFYFPGAFSLFFSHPLCKQALTPSFLYTDLCPNHIFCGHCTCVIFKLSLCYQPSLCISLIVTWKDSSVSCHKALSNINDFIVYYKLIWLSQKCCHLSRKRLYSLCIYIYFFTSFNGAGIFFYLIN